MEDSIMLVDGRFIKISAVSDNKIFNPLDENMLFLDNGRLLRFRKGSISYIALSKVVDGTITNIFDGYFSERNFWSYNDLKLKKENSLAAQHEALGLRKDGEFFDYHAEQNSNVFFCYRYIEKVNNTLELVTKYGSKERKLLDQNSTINDVSLSYSRIELAPEIAAYGIYVIGKKFLGPNGTLYELGDIQKAVLFDILYILNELFKDQLLIDFLEKQKLYEVFQTHLYLYIRYGPINSQIDPAYHKLYSEEYFSTLRLNLVEFRYWILQFNQLYYNVDINRLAAYIINIFPTVELSSLKYEVKINLLDKIVKGNLWIIGDWVINDVNEELAVIKVINSMYREENNTPVYTEIDSFMDYLDTRIQYDKYETMFMVLYKKINDGVSPGKGNTRLLINAIYNLWTQSKYNPNHENAQIAESALTKFNYTPYTATDSPTVSPGSIDINAAPLLLGYQSEKILLWYSDNFKFPFFRDKICAVNIDENDRKRQIGYYHIFQPVMVKAEGNVDNVIKFPIKGAAVNNENINNSIPVFFLKYIDDAGDYSDAQNTIGLVLDIALLFTGVGNITKLKHFRHLSKLRKLATIPQTEKILVLEALSGGLGALEIIAGVSSIILNYVEHNCEDPAFCEKLNYWLFALEVASLSGDLLAKRALRRSAEEVIRNVPVSGWPAAFTDPTDPLYNARHIIERVADISEFLNNFRTTRLSNRLALRNAFDGLSNEKKATFFYDFERQADSILDKLNENPRLFNLWKSDEIVHLHIHKKNLEFLGAYLRFTDKPWEIDHIVKLYYHQKFKPIGGHTIGIINSGEARVFSNEIPPTKSTIINGHIKYENLYFKRPPHLSQGGKEIPPGSGNWYKNKEMQYIINPQWDIKRIKEEMSYAFSNKKIKPDFPISGPGRFGETKRFVRIEYDSQFTDGTSIELWMRNYDKDPIEPVTVIRTNHLSLMLIK